VQYGVTEADLELGVLLGRYDRCDISGQLSWDPGRVSRVHALLLKEGDDIYAIDLASTNGTIVDGIATPVAQLGPEAVIELAKGNRVFWRTL
jgi:pSer/pThr/pTyr-binding forkhead associated (FHA) protein